AVDHAANFFHQFFAGAEVGGRNGIVEGDHDFPTLHSESSFGHDIVCACNRHGYHRNLAGFGQIEGALFEGQELAVERASTFHEDGHVNSLVNNLLGGTHRGDSSLAVPAIDRHQRRNSHGAAQDGIVKEFVSGHH